MTTDDRTDLPLNFSDSSRLNRTDKRHCSIFDLPPNFFDSSRLISAGAVSSTEKPSFPDSVDSLGISMTASKIEEEEEDEAAADEGFEAVRNTDMLAVPSRMSCNTCKAEFDSLQDQRSHFKSDLHRLNVKLSLAGKKIVKEEDFDEFTPDTFPRDFDVSSISGSEDEDERTSHTNSCVNEGSTPNLKQKLFVSLQSGDKVSLWKCFFLKDTETILYDNEHTSLVNKEVQGSYLRENNVIQNLQQLVREPKDSRLRIVLLARGGHFAGCVFDGTKVVAHKTFHRYVVRAKAGKKQSSKDGSGRSIHSAGASLRRYNELALKKDIQELLASWKSYFDVSHCVFIHAPSNNRQLFFSDEKALFGNHHCDVRNIPSTVRRPTLKEAQRIYNQLSQVAYEVEEKELPDEEILASKKATIINDSPGYKNLVDMVTTSRSASSSINKVPNEQSVSSESDTEVICTSTALHNAAETGDAIKVLDLLEKGLDPTIKEERGKTPYMLATDKEVRNTFRRFMAANLDKWDWNAAKVPSALTKEIEESQAAKQAEKDAKRKAKAKELKKLRKAREKQARAETAAAAQSKSDTAAPLPAPGVRPQLASTVAPVSKEEELRRKLAEEREKRAAAAERRIADTASSTCQRSSSITLAPTSQADDMACSCCKASLLGKVPFHRYNYKYCSSTCMHVHKEFLEDG